MTDAMKMSDIYNSTNPPFKYSEVQDAKFCLQFGYVDDIELRNNDYYIYFDRQWFYSSISNMEQGVDFQITSHDGDVVILSKKDRENVESFIAEYFELNEDEDESHYDYYPEFGCYNQIH